MNVTLRLTLDGLLDALRMKAHSFADNAESGHRPKRPRLAESGSKPDMKGKSRKKGDRDDLAGG
jgi:hypothetical protein